jgi:serine protease Do
VAVRAGAQGIGFAIPVDTVIRSAAEMLSIRQRKGLLHGMICRDRIDLVAPQVTHVQGPKGDTPKPSGWARVTLVERVEANGPAARAGLHAGDVLLKVGEQPVACGLDVERVLLDRAAGDRVPVVVHRSGTEQRFEVVLQPVQRNGPSPADVK